MPERQLGIHGLSVNRYIIMSDDDVFVVCLMLIFWQQLLRGTRMNEQSNRIETDTTS